MEVPYQSLSSETLRSMIEELVTRDGTDYGVAEVSLAAKVDQVLAQLKVGEMFIQYDEAAELCEIVTRQR